MYLVYVDDSGDSTFRTYTALAIPVTRWTSYLKGWLTFRKQLFRDSSVPTDYELHAYKWLSAHPDPMDEILDAQPPILQQGRDHRRDRSRAFERGTKVIGTFEDARLFTVASETVGVHDLYGRLVRWLDEWLDQEAVHGLVVIDGEDQGLKYRRRHRDLAIRTRRIIEDPQPMPSHESAPTASTGISSPRARPNPRPSRAMPATSWNGCTGSTFRTNPASVGKKPQTPNPEARGLPKSQPLCTRNRGGGQRKSLYEGLISPATT